MPWLAENYPDLVPRYEAMYAKQYAPPADRNRVGSTVTGIVRALGGTRPSPAPPCRWSRGDDGSGGSTEQLTLV